MKKVIKISIGADESSFQHSKEQTKVLKQNFLNHIGELKDEIESGGLDFDYEVVSKEYEKNVKGIGPGEISLILLIISSVSFSVSRLIKAITPIVNAYIQSKSKGEIELRFSTGEEMILRDLHEKEREKYLKKFLKQNIKGNELNKSEDEEFIIHIK